MPPKNPYVDGWPRLGRLVYLPFRLEHALMTCTQRLLEETCFHFAEKWIPDLLKRQGWDIPEAGELNHWWKALRNCQVPEHAVKFSSSKEVEQLFVYLHQVRHAAVHRLRTDTEVISRMLKDALRFTIGFDDHLRRNKLWDIQFALLSQDFELLGKTIDMPVQEFQTFNFGDRPVAGYPKGSGVPKAERESQEPLKSKLSVSTHISQTRQHVTLASIGDQKAVHQQTANPQTVHSNTVLENTTNKKHYAVDVIDLTNISDDEIERTAKNHRQEVIDLTEDSNDEAEGAK